MAAHPAPERSFFPPNRHSDGITVRTRCTDNETVYVATATDGTAFEHRASGEYEAVEARFARAKVRGLIANAPGAQLRVAA